jgi:hypothetical protein
VSRNLRLVVFLICECYPRLGPAVPPHGGYDCSYQAEHNEEDGLTVKGTENDWLDNVLTNVVWLG